MAMNDPVLFVSHVSDDRDAAMEIVAELERRGIRCWVAPRNVRLGRPFDDEIDAAIKKCLAMLLIFPDHCNENDYIRRELTVAGNCRKLVLPVRIEDAQPKRGLRVRLSDLHWIDGFVAREQALDAVAQALSLGPATARQTGDAEAGSNDAVVLQVPSESDADLGVPVFSIEGKVSRVGSRSVSDSSGGR